MLKTDRVLVVEGKYDAIRLANIVDAVIVTTDGFSVFHDREKQQMLRQLAEKRGLILLTDSDSAGFLIRNFLKSGIPEQQLTQVYIPDIYGKERRKDRPSAEGKLGVEGIPDEILTAALRRAGISETGDVGSSADADRENRRTITELDFYEDGFSGTPDSRARRLALLKKLRLPERMTGKQLLKVINLLVTYEEYRSLVESMDQVGEEPYEN